MQNINTHLTRIVVKFYEHAGINYTCGNSIIETIFRRDTTGQWQHFIKSNAGLQIAQLFTSVTPGQIKKLAGMARTIDAKYTPPDFLTYYVFAFPASIHPGKSLLQLTSLANVELAYLQSVATAPAAIQKKAQKVFPRDYLSPAPVGVNAKYAWTINGGKGSSRVKFIDIEQGWNLGISDMNVKTLPLTGINHPAFGNHGAAVLSIILMKDDGAGGMGIAPGVSGHIISQWRPGGEANDADAIMAAITYLDFGDVLLLETQSFCSLRNSKVWPAEIQEASFQAIRLAAALGIIVIEAAGNGDAHHTAGNDLDHFVSGKKKLLNPGSRHFRDSGAIMVSASYRDLPYQRVRFSNFGKRVNCFAWGEEVATGGKHSSSLNYYTANFDGTSSASAIIAGVALSVQSIAEVKYNRRLGPAQMRTILSSELYGTSSANGRAHDKMGVMPDLEKIIDLALPASQHV